MSSEDGLETTDEGLTIYILPLISLLGLTGNLISLVTIFHSRLRRVNANIYLIVLTTADSAFLIGILLVFFKVDWISYEYCVAVEYVLMTASYISSWSTAALTIERYLAIAHPLSHMKYGHVDRARIMCYWVPIPFVLQLFQFFSLEPATDTRKCALKEANYQIIAQVADTVLCYLVPCAVIVVLNLLVAVKVRKSQQRFHEEAKSASTRRQGGSSTSSGTWTRILWVMPLVFVVLNTPFYVFSMVEIVLQIVYQSPPSFDNRSENFVLAYNFAHYLYYSNTAIDVLVYAFSSATFRKTAVIAWKGIICYLCNFDRNHGKNLVGYVQQEVAMLQRVLMTILRQTGKAFAFRRRIVIITDQTSRMSCRMTTCSEVTKEPRRSVSPNQSVPLLESEVQAAQAATHDVAVTAI